MVWVGRVVAVQAVSGLVTAAHVQLPGRLEQRVLQTDDILGEDRLLDALVRLGHVEGSRDVRRCPVLLEGRKEVLGVLVEVSRVDAALF